MGLSRLLASGLDMADYVELSALTPWLILATEKDFFTPEGARLVYEEARRWFGLYSAEDKVKLFVGPGTHGTPRETREMVYGWMIRWLKDGKGDPRELPLPLHPDHELLVTKSGRVEDEPGSRKLYQLVLDEFHARKRERTIPELLAELQRLGIPTNGKAPAFKVLEDSPGPDFRRQRISFETEPGLNIAGNLYLPTSAGKRSAVLLVSDNWSALAADKLVKRGSVVLELEPRDSRTNYDERPYLGNWRPNARADLIGRNLPAMRAHDILRGVDLLATRDDVSAASIRASARGVKGIWLLLAAAVDPRIGRVWLDRTPYSIRLALEKPINRGLSDAVIPGFALHWDLQHLVKAIGSRPVLWTDPTNWMGTVVPLGSPFRYRYLEEPDDGYLNELLQQ
jgi:hypothetical protein